MKIELFSDRGSAPPAGPHSRERLRSLRSINLLKLAAHYVAIGLYMLLPTLSWRLWPGWLGDAVDFLDKEDLILYGLFAGYVTLAYLLNLNRFSRIDAGTGKGLLGVLKSFRGAAFDNRAERFVGLAFRLYLVVAGISFMAENEALFPGGALTRYRAYFESTPTVSDHAPGWGIGLLAAAILHWGIFRLLRAYANRQPNHKLTILRVFGDETQAALTFGRLTTTWAHLGSWFTVVDPSYLKQRYRIFSWRSIGAAITLFAALMITKGLFFRLYEELANLTWPHLDSLWSRPDELHMTTTPLLMWAGYLAYWATQVHRSYPVDRDGIARRLRRTLRHPRGTDLLFKALPMFCYANTWRLAVEAFVETSDVVLMDLRTFSKERRGCAYEIDYLFNAIAIDRILFLVDRHTDVEAVRGTLVEQWASLSASSPNLALDEPEVRIFDFDEESLEHQQMLFDLLLGAGRERIRESQEPRGRPAVASQPDRIRT